MNVWRWVFYTLGLIPWAFIVSLVAFYIHAGQILGHLPSYNQPDPKDLDIYKDYSPFVDWTAEIYCYSFILWFLMTLAYLIIKKRKAEWMPLVLSGTGQIFGILLFLSGIFNWYID